MSPITKPPLTAAPRALVRAYAIASRFYATGAVLLATGVATSVGAAEHVAGIGQVLGASVLPQVLDLGLARRISMESAVIDDVHSRERAIQSLTGQYIWFSLGLGVLVACYVALVPALLQRYGGEILLAVVLACLSAPISVVATTALYGWRQPSIQQMLISAAVDLLLLGLQLLVALQWPAHIPLALAAALLLRQLLLCLVLRTLDALAAALHQARQSVLALAQTAAQHGAAELRLGVFCVAAWGVDPFLYVHFVHDALVPTHLTVTRLAQAAISVMNVFLISTLWAGHRSTNPAALPVRARRAMWGFAGAAALVLAAAWPLAAATQPGGWPMVAVALAVLTATAVAMWRQQLAVEYLRHKTDLRDGASYAAMLVVIAVKGAAVLGSNVVLLECASIIASLAYLIRLNQHHQERPLDPA